jgi:hypothetical protein
MMWRTCNDSRLDSAARLAGYNRGLCAFLVDSFVTSTLEAIEKAAGLRGLRPALHVGDRRDEAGGYCFPLHENFPSIVVISEG